ncbi:hypothetical protein EIP91_007291 [Steccherinum ochraceum]|uniref:DUF6534 domain-containing protein n=1 Tax=Steccherinum ochraceum TaxID=92696 RepID=A0A4R0RCL6_9APHY|nr:hypothetical protein EIP91_007291 [Steccherinum ochraceum]
MAGPPTDEQLVGGYFIIAYLSLMLVSRLVYLKERTDDPIFNTAAFMGSSSLKATHMPYMLEKIRCYSGLPLGSLALIMHSAYLFSVTDFGHPQALAVIPWSAGSSVMIGMVITACVQLFYIRRIWILSNHNWILVAFVIAVCVGLSMSAAVDIIIASILIYYLYKARTGFKSTDRLIHALMAYTVNSGFITMICSTLSVISFFVLPQSLVFAGLVQMSSKLYANSFLGTLNARQRLRKRSNAPSTQRPTGDSSTANSGSKGRQIEIYQSTFKAATHDPIASTYGTSLTFGTVGEEMEMDGSFDKQPMTPV